MTRTATSPATAIPMSAVIGDSGDCVAVGHGVGTGGFVVLTTAVVVGTAEIA